MIGAHCCAIRAHDHLVSHRFTSVPRWREIVTAISILYSLYALPDKGTLSWRKVSPDYLFLERTGRPSNILFT